MKNSLTERFAAGLRRWTLSMAGEDLVTRLAVNRPENEYGVDSFGFNLDYAIAGAGPFVWLYKNYFRCETHGVENVPKGGCFWSRTTEASCPSTAR